MAAGLMSRPCCDDVVVVARTPYGVHGSHCAAAAPEARREGVHLLPQDGPVRTHTGRMACTFVGVNADLPRPIYCCRLRDSCQYGQRCKFHHPAEKLAGNLAPLNVMGMPGMAPYPMGPGKRHTLSPPLPRPSGCYHGPFC